jgi:integrase
MARRSDGESSIYRDKDGRWQGYVSMGAKEGGRRDRRHVSGKRRVDVVAKVRALEAKRDAGVANGAGRSLTVTAWLDHWLENIAVRRVRPSTFRWYSAVIRLHLNPALGHHRLNRLQPEHVEALYRKLEADGLASATVLQVHRVLSRALKVAMQRGRIVRNVATLVDAPTLNRAEVQPLTADDARAILAAARGQCNAARWSVALALGLRQGEALGLPWAAVDLDAGALTVRQALQRQTGKGLVVVQPKSRAGRRTIALPPELVEALREHQAAQLVEQRAAANVWEPHGFVFCQPNGCPIDPSTDSRAWRALLVDAGVRPARLHDARHTAATLLLQQGVPARVVMDILGHSQIGLTLGTYSHVVPELAQQAAEGMGAALWPPAATTAAPAPKAGERAEG